jgi:hypothetical protein
MVWYRYPDWARRQIAEGGWDGVHGEVGDVDGDGRAEIVMGGVVWFRNPGADGEPWVMTSIDSLRLHDVELADLDSDGRLDVVGRDQSAFGDPQGGAAIHVYLQTGPNVWTKNAFPCPAGEGLAVADIDRDGDTDILIADRWYANAGKGDGWSEHVIGPTWREPDAKLAIADINGDGRPDLVAAPAELRGDSYKLSWFETPPNPAEDEWAEHIVAPEIETVVHALGAGDFNRDGKMDIAYAEMHQGEDPDEVALLLNLGGGDVWRKQVLSNDGSHDIAIGDIGGDGDLDIIGANHAGDKQALMLWENEGLKHATHD